MLSVDIEELKKFIESENVTRHIMRFFEYMPKVDDIIISILKGHLLIEEKLSELIIVEANKPQVLKESRLTFHQKLCIAEALHWHKNRVWIWQSCRKLNSIRNNLSHELEPSDINRRIREFLKFVENYYPPHGKKQIKNKQNTRLLFAIGMVYSDLSAYLEACRNSVENSND
ncbi:MAG: hypothetical protein JXR49_19560 [Acidobacteria bacterium]|nr:hypothetical protein [Acidobacteriota bacterium]